MALACTAPLCTRREPPVNGKRPCVLAASAPFRASAWSFSIFAAACASSASTSVTHARGPDTPPPADAAEATPIRQPTAVMTRKPGRDMRSANTNGWGCKRKKLENHMPFQNIHLHKESNYIFDSCLRFIHGRKQHFSSKTTAAAWSACIVTHRPPRS